MANIADIVSHKRTVEITHPKTDQPIGLRITLYSVEDDRTKAVRKAITDKRQHLEARGKNFKSDDLEENMRNLQFTAIEGWEWHQNADGEDATFTDENPKPVFNRKNFYEIITALPWIADQITKEFSDTQAFF